MRNALLAMLSFALFVPAVVAQEVVPACPSVDYDKEKSEAQGLHWLGVRQMPFSKDSAVFYESGGVVVFSPIEDGCVSRNVYPSFANYAEEKDA